MITSATADQLDTLAAAIAAATAPDPALDAQYLALIAPAMLAIDGRVMAPGFRYTLNATNALQGRPKHWHLTLDELDQAGAAFASASFQLLVSGQFVGYGYSYGATLGLAACAGICKIWAIVIRMWLAGNYALAVSQPA